MPGYKPGWGYSREIHPHFLARDERGFIDSFGQPTWLNMVELFFSLDFQLLQPAKLDLHRRDTRAMVLRTEESLALTCVITHLLHQEASLA